MSELGGTPSPPKCMGFSQYKNLHKYCMERAMVVTRSGDKQGEVVGEDMQKVILVPKYQEISDLLTKEKFQRLL